MAKSQSLSAVIRAIERAVAALRRGEAVRVGGHLAMAVEGITAAEIHTLEGIAGSKAKLLLSGARLGKKEAQALPMTQPKKLAQYVGLEAGGLPKTGLKKATAEQASLLSLMQIAELIPAALFATVAASRKKAAFKGLFEVTPAQIAAYEEAVALCLKPVARAPLTLKHAGRAEIIGFRPESGGKEHYAIVVADGLKQKAPLIRVHSSCYTGDLLGSLACDCGDQLHESLRRMQKEGGGILLYLMQEGRGIGLVNKLRAYHLQAEGLDTVEANRHLGFGDDDRLFGPAVQMLKSLKIKQVRLLTNNPRKARELEKHGIRVAERVPLVIAPHTHTAKYLSAKSRKLGHILPS